jgi:hypothetical protein
MKRKVCRISSSLTALLCLAKKPQIYTKLYYDYQHTKLHYSSPLVYSQVSLTSITNIGIMKYVAE